MVMARSLLRATASSTLATSEAIAAVNDMLLSDIDPSMFMTLFYAVLDSRDRSLTFTNAGHNYPLWYRSNRKELTSLRTDDLPIGMFGGHEYHQRTIELEHGDRIVFFTDGVTEAVDPNDMMFGDGRLKELVMDSVVEAPEIVLELVYCAVEEFTGLRSQSDDMTAMVLMVD